MMTTVPLAEAQKMVESCGWVAFTNQSIMPKKELEESLERRRRK
jgi:hypothetical protein